MVQFAARDAETERRRRANVRLRVLMLLFVLGFASIGARLIDLTTTGGASQALHVGATPEAGRADIVDRAGRLLATTIPAISVYADPRRVNDKPRTARTLAALLDLDADDLERRFAGPAHEVSIKRRITPIEEARLQEVGLPGVTMRLDRRRVYPYKHLVSHVLGFVGTENDGLEGVELGLDDRLRRPEQGPLRLSLDVEVQGVARAATAGAFERFRAKGACTLVFDLKARAFVAFVSLPDFDPNDAASSPSGHRRNRCNGDVYELGSLFKILATGMALDSGKVSLFDRFDASDPIVVNGHKISDDHAKRRWLSLPEVFAFSSNIGTVEMVFEAGGAALQKPFLKNLGLFERAAIELPGGARPILPPAKWAPITEATVAYGHGIAVSPVAFVEAAAALIDDGRYKGGTLLARPVEAVPEGERVIAPPTVEDLRWLLWLTVERGTGDNARNPYYLTGGKTGTADKAVPGRGYVDGAVVASFLSVLPIEDPRYLVMVTLDEPRGDAGTYGQRYGGWTAAPVAAEIVERMGPLMRLAPSPRAARAILEARVETVPAVNGRTHAMEEGFAAVRLDR